MKKAILISALLIIATIINLQAQSVGINSNGAAPDASAMLDVASTDKGVLIPRVDYDNLPQDPATGLLVYVTSNGPNGNNLFYYYDGTGWQPIIGVSNVLTPYGNAILGIDAGSNTLGNNNVAVGNSALYMNITGYNNTAVGSSAGYNCIGYGNVFIGYNAGLNEAGNNKLYIDNSLTNSPLIWGDFQNRKLVINGKSANNINERTFFVNGSAGGTGIWWNDSDQRLKKNVSTISKPLAKVMKLRGVNFEWIDQTNHDKGMQMGFIAQEVEKVIPEVVSVPANESGTYSMQYAAVTALLVEAIKAQQAEIEKQTAEINNIKKELDNIKALLKK